MSSDPNSAAVPRNSLVFGYGPMLPLVAAAIGAWCAGEALAALAMRLAILWAALILAFVAGVRRGYGFGAAQASTTVEIATMLAYLIPAGLALVLQQMGQPTAALALLLIGYALVMLLDVRAAKAGNAPRHFARLRGPQMGIAVVSLALLIAASIARPAAGGSVNLLETGRMVEPRGIEPLTSAMPLQRSPS